MPRPIKAKDLIPKTSIDCNKDPELVNDVVDFFYLKLRKKIEDLKDPIITIPILGKFRISKYKIEKSIDTLSFIIVDEPKTDDFKEMKKYQMYKERLTEQVSILSKIKDLENDRIKRKKDLGQQK